MKIDLHLHSYYSGDGIHKVDLLTSLFEPGDVIALADHETIAGWEDLESSCKKRNLKPIYGVEWFAGYSHILSYFPDRNIPISFNDFISERRMKEKLTMISLAAQLKLEDNSFPDYETLIRINSHPEKILGMMVLGCQLKKHKKIGFKEAIIELRYKKKNIINFPKILEPIEIIEMMSKWGAVSILAHPFRRKEITKNFLTEFTNLVKTYKDAGLNGIELHPFEDDLNYKIINICKQFDLIWTIGSDYHHHDEGIFPRRLPFATDEILIGLKKLNLL